MHLKRQHLHSIAALAACLTLVAPMLVGCGGSDKKDSDHRLPDTLRVVTLYSPGSYFIYRDQPMGYDYDLVTEMAKEKGLPVVFEVAPSLSRAIEMLDSGKVDLLAYEVPVTAEYKEQLIPCGPENITRQVLVQPAKGRDTLITDVTQLVGREVYVEKGSKYEARLNNLNDELGGGILIRSVDADTLITEDMLALVNSDSIPLAVVDSDIARLNRTYYPNLDISLAISFEQRSQWAVAKNKSWLADSIDAWIDGEKPRQAQAEIMKRYFEVSKAQAGEFNLSFSNGLASPYDALYRRHATPAGWDWRLLAAQGFTESRFDSTARSWAGASGVMQIMPKTAKDFGLKKNEMTSPERSIETAVKILNAYDKIMQPKVADATERQKFVMAAYNAGPGHVLDAISLAKKYGLNPQKWDNNVEKAMLMKMNRKYYRDPVVKHGYSRGRETVDYVDRIWNYYERVKQKVPA